MEARLNVEDNSSTHFEYNLSWDKGRVISIEPDATLQEAAQMMRDEQIGSLLVMCEDARGEDLLGIVTDRDIALCLASDLILDDLRITDIMSDIVVTASADDSVFRLIHIMKNAGVTRLPLVDNNDKVVGVVTARNLIEILVSSFFDLTQISDKQKQRERTRH